MSQAMLVDILNWCQDSSQYLALPVFEGMPKQYCVEAVFQSWERRCLDVMISSDEFDEVPEGCLPERIGIAEHIIIEKRTTTNGDRKTVEQKVGE
jgi:hypothetical protein